MISPNNLRDQIFIDIIQSYARSKLCICLYLYFLALTVTIVLEVHLILTGIIPTIFAIAYFHNILRDSELLYLRLQCIVLDKSWAHSVNDSLGYGAVLLKSGHNKEILYFPKKFPYKSIVSIYYNQNEKKYNYLLGKTMQEDDYKEMKVQEHSIVCSDSLLSHLSLLQTAKLINEIITNGFNVYVSDHTGSYRCMMVVMAYLMKYESSGVHEAYISVKISQPNSLFKESSKEFKHMQAFEKYIRPVNPSNF